MIFQEQIALLAHKLGDNVSLDEGNKLRKLLTKKGTGKSVKEKEKIREKFKKWKISALEEVARLKLKKRIENIDKAGLKEIFNG